LYRTLFNCNAAIEGLNSSQANALTFAVKKQLLGEAKFMRGFLFFYLVNEFGDIPLVLSTDPKVNSQLGRSSASKVYEQIVSDLKDAENNLSDKFLDVRLLSTTNERVRPTKWAAAALLARVYLYTKNYLGAELEATTVINNSTDFILVPLNSVFLKNSQEAIFQIQPTDLNFNTQEGRTLIIPVSGPTAGSITTNPVYLSKSLLNSFETGDKRAVCGNWIDTTIYKKTSTTLDTVAFPFKYKVNTSIGVNSVDGLQEYFMVLRLGEQYLIRAEARAMLGNTGGAQTDLNAIRNRADLGNYSGATDQASLLAVILNERRHELFSEWGQRWFDLKRTGKIDEVMSVVTPIKANGVPWKSYQQLLPIPVSEILLNQNLTQNSGY
jgi:hypothetical protein